MATDAPITERSPVQLGLVIALVGGVAWAFGKWSDIGETFATKELMAANVATLQAQIAGVEKSLAGQIEALRAEIRASDRTSK